MNQTLTRLRPALCSLAVLLAAVLLNAQRADAAPRPNKLLVVTVTKGWRHDSIPAAERMIKRLADESGAFTVDYARTDDELKAKTTAAALKGYDGVFFAQTSGDIPLADPAAFLGWIKSGRAFVGMHSATDTFPGFPPYIEMIGGQFESHPPEHITVRCIVEDTTHPATNSLGKTFSAHDEIYVLKHFVRARVHTLVSLDKHPATGAPGYFPLAWNRMYGRGRVFYTALGHRSDVIESDWYGRHILGGVRWALGLARGSARPQRP
jgi:type 1 glutamine amidotransferase